GGSAGSAAAGGAGAAAPGGEAARSGRRVLRAPCSPPPVLALPTFALCGASRRSRVRLWPVFGRRRRAARRGTALAACSVHSCGRLLSPLEVAGCVSRQLMPGLLRLSEQRLRQLQ